LSASECRNYHRPTSLREALALIAGAEVPLWPVAGGTDLLVKDHRRQMPPGPWEMMSLRRIHELGMIESDGDSVRIGSAVTMREMAASPLLNEMLPVLALAADHMASPQIRAVATIGGNLANASPAADLAVPLLILDAEVELASCGGVSGPNLRRIPLADFFTGPGSTVCGKNELLSAVVIPPQPAGMRFASHKPGTRPAMVCAHASAGLGLLLDGETVAAVRVAFGALADRPIRGSKTEAALHGQTLDEKTLERASETARWEVAPISDVRGSETYRRELAASLVRRLIRACLPDHRASESSQTTDARARAHHLGPSAADPEPHAGSTTLRSSAAGGKPHLAHSDTSGIDSFPDGRAELEISCVINGEPVQARVQPAERLVDLLRERLGLKGTKTGCGEGDCGACTVLIDGVAVNSCLYPAAEVAGRAVTTIEGLQGRGGDLHPAVQAFVELGAVQCGFCTPGMILRSWAFVCENPNPSEEQIRRSVEGNICRCTGYVKIVDAVRRLATEGVE
jgi:carbon-monoxide dehydrogenase medium subunit